MPTGILIVAVLALVMAAAAVQSTISGLLSLVRDLLSAVFVNIGRLFVLGACLICLLTILVHSISAGTPPGTH